MVGGGSRGETPAPLAPALDSGGKKHVKRGSEQSRGFTGPLPTTLFNGEQKGNAVQDMRPCLSIADFSKNGPSHKRIRSFSACIKEDLTHNGMTLRVERFTQIDLYDI